MPPHEDNPPVDAGDSLPPVPSISMRTVHMTGLLVDVYGLDELAPGATRVSCLWLHHQRLRSKEHMADIASRCIAAWNSARDEGSTATDSRGLIALAFDQRNHGTRQVHEPANMAWKKGNATHAQDMFGVTSGAVADQSVLLDAVGGYLFHEQKATGGERDIDQHLALGISLGGHSVWQLMFADPRVRAAVIVIGCPDFMSLMSNRARKSKLPTYPMAKGDAGTASFIGSKDFPPSLVDACAKFDPKGILFGTSSVPKSPSGSPDESLKQCLHERLEGKKFLLCSGGDDRLVPYSCSVPFLDWLKEATGVSFKEEAIFIEDKVYPGIGHEFSADMVKDAVQFIVDAVASADSGSEKGNEDQRASKI
ncbi:hypothetical protein B0H67DRAFT_484770 [Lasiosphaeris hirsuta]|uniref:Uncharacterized protein n=1 Tax=Lasiosphaeris hirsuta TaxID=260670 RepID=A0AA40APR1_9PEZI|nr:hypothetical protein B0H67DRAFT_484770 [Lasiosphaeris hirsuta]